MIEDGWMPIDEYCATYNERRNTIHARVNTGAWERGVHYAKPDGSAGFVHVERARAWHAELQLKKDSAKQKSAATAPPAEGN